MRQQLFNPAVHVRRQPRQHIFQVRMGVVTIQFRRLNQTHGRRCSLSAAQRVRKQPVVPAYRNWPDLVLSAGGHQLGLELGAVSATAEASLG